MRTILTFVDPSCERSQKTGVGAGVGGRCRRSLVIAMKISLPRREIQKGGVVDNSKTSAYKGTMSTADDVRLTLYSAKGQFGSKMQALNSRQQQFVLALLATGGRNQSEAARIAGYAHANVVGSRLGTAANIQAALKEEALRIASEVDGQDSRDPAVLDGIAEEAANRIRAGAILGASALQEIAADPDHKDRLKAAQDLLDRADVLRPKHDQKITVEHVTHTPAQKIERIVQLAQSMGIDPQTLLGQYGVVIDAEFKLIEGPTEDDLSDMFAPIGE